MNNICIDSRTVKKNDIFIAIKGEKFHASEFIPEVLKKEPQCIVCNNDELTQKILQNLFIPSSTKIILVDDTTKYLQQIAKEHLKKWQDDNHVAFAISGSNGKTTTKEMLFHILNSLFPNKINATKANNNNHIGVPLTILDTHEDHIFSIIELGSNHPGEMQLLMDIVQPHFGTTTNIGATHLEFFDTLENVFIEETKIYESISKSSQKSKCFFLNQNDEYLKKLPQEKWCHVLGENPLFKNLSAPKVTGEHNLWNLCVACEIAYYFYPQYEKEIIHAALNFSPTKNRSEWMQVENTAIFLDAYNANPSSMKAAIEGFLSTAEENEKILLVLGDMYELGTHTEECHQEITKFLNQKNIQECRFIGTFSDFYQRNYLGKSLTFSDSESYKNQFLLELKKFDRVFIKGSRGVKLEKLLF